MIAVKRFRVNIVTRTDSLEANNALLFSTIVRALRLNEQHQQPESAHFQLDNRYLSRNLMIFYT